MRRTLKLAQGTRRSIVDNAGVAVGITYSEETAMEVISRWNGFEVMVERLEALAKAADNCAMATPDRILRGVLKREVSLCRAIAAQARGDL